MQPKTNLEWEIISRVTRRAARAANGLCNVWVHRQSAKTYGWTDQYVGTQNPTRNDRSLAQIYVN